MKEDLAYLSGPQVVGLRRWNQDWLRLSVDLTQDRRAWAAMIRDVMRAKEEAECWTQWFDRDNPSGHGDFETLSELHKENPSKICDHPIEIEVQTTSGVRVGSTNNVIYRLDMRRGFICRNVDQLDGGCADYKVRFLCPLKFCNPKGCWTAWFDRDNPSGHGDFETLLELHKENPSKICDHPIQIEVKTTSGAICRTQWYNHDNPSGTGDFELLEKLRVKNPNEICPFPLDIEVQTVAGNTGFNRGQKCCVRTVRDLPPQMHFLTLRSKRSLETLWLQQGITMLLTDFHCSYDGDKVLFHLSRSDTTIGFICQNADQEGGRCSDYKLRFVCPIDFCNRRG
ncbi:uncharacterized protein LOC109510709 [Hippocampus comes]|uniref:uncharacterized protein LOC109510709 n=1 Tax=Hippocampus comes TaxID=109280 RepID=UPI00094EC278|nr:PREDICTED: uncharacterized protein LOC109510709 [Hippocampus comes]